MRTQIAAAVAISSAFLLSTDLLAQGFNERGEDWVRSVVSTRSAPEAPHIAASTGHNQRGVDWVAAIPTNSSSRLYDEVYIVQTGHNERGANWPNIRAVQRSSSENYYAYGD